MSARSISHRIFKNIRNGEIGKGLPLLAFFAVFYSFKAVLQRMIDLIREVHDKQYSHESKILAKRPADQVDLIRQFSRRRQDQTNWARFMRGKLGLNHNVPDYCSD